MRKHSVRTKTIGHQIEYTQFNKKSMGTECKNGPPFYTKTLLVNNRPIEFIVDTDSPVTLIPKTKFNNITMKPVTVDYRDVNDSKIKFEGKTTANIENDGTKETIGATHNNQTNTPITRAGLDGKTGNHVTHRQ